MDDLANDTPTTDCPCPARRSVVLGMTGLAAGALAACSSGSGSQSLTSSTGAAGGSASPSTSDPMSAGTSGSPTGAADMNESPMSTAKATPTGKASAAADPMGTGTAMGTGHSTTPAARNGTKTPVAGSTPTRTTTPMKPTPTKPSATKPMTDPNAAGALAKLSSVPVGGSLHLAGQGIIITRTGATSVVGLSDVCTHQGCKVAPAGGSLNCPCHGGKFNPRTGAVTAGPPPAPLARVALTVKGNYIHKA